MPANTRLDQIVAWINERGFLSVEELSQLCQVSKMTIRRDLDQLEKENRVRRTFGGAAPLVSASTPPVGAAASAPPRGVAASAPPWGIAASMPPSRVPAPAAPGLYAWSEGGEGEPAAEPAQTAGKPDSFLVDRVDVLIATSVNPSYDGRILEGVTRKDIPIIAESLAIQDEESVVAVDNYQAGQDMGRWAGQYANRHWAGKASVLDLTYSLTNTLTRSRGFAAGIREAAPQAEIVLSINAQSRYATAYQLTRDALTVHKHINVIFAINDTTALGAIHACRDLHLDPEGIIVMPFGLEGDTLKNALMDGAYCKIGLAMFPEIVGPTCVEAALAAFDHQSLPRHIVTPYVILTSATLPDYYQKRDDRWELCWETVNARLSIPMRIEADQPRSPGRLPRRIGFIIPFSEHDWYKNLIVSMQSYAGRLKIDFEVIDADQNIKDEIEIRRRAIARAAAAHIKPEEVILIDGGPITNYLAEELLERRDLTIITNSMATFEILKQNPNLTLLLTGGAYRHSSQMLVGPTAEGALRELRADKLFLMVTGASLNFGLSHTNISEVTMKQTMIRSAREVILLADHTYFGQESTVQVAPLTVINRLITDDALPASYRLDLSKLGIQIILANE